MEKDQEIEKSKTSQLIYQEELQWLKRENEQLRDQMKAKDKLAEKKRCSRRKVGSVLYRL